MFLGVTWDPIEIIETLSLSCEQTTAEASTHSWSVIPQKQFPMNNEQPRNIQECQPTCCWKGQTNLTNPSFYIGHLWKHWPFLAALFLLRRFSHASTPAFDPEPPLTAASPSTHPWPRICARRSWPAKGETNWLHQLNSNQMVSWGTSGHVFSWEIWSKKCRTTMVETWKLDLW
jgi:hypothetical protein